MKQINMLFVLLGGMLAFFPSDINASTFIFKAEVKGDNCETKEFGSIPKGKNYTAPGCVRLECGDDGSVSGSTCPAPSTPFTLGPGCQMTTGNGVGEYPDCCKPRIKCDMGKKE